jgi:hypothetical protein
MSCWSKILLSRGWLVLIAGLTACGKPPPSSPSAANVQQAFKGTRADVREFADQAVAAESKGDLSTAFVHYRALSLNPELTPEQRNLANQSMIEMNKKLHEASGKGDAEAEKVLQMYRATK